MQPSLKVSTVINDAIASAPGKVLLTGGYLVLQEGLSGLVVSSSSRFFSRVSWIANNATTTYENIDSNYISRISCGPDADHALIARTAAAVNAAVTKARATGGIALIIISPQFHAAWGYSLPCESPHSLIVAEIDTPPSPFVEAAIAASLAAAAANQFDDTTHEEGDFKSGCDSNEGGPARLCSLLHSRANAGGVLVVVLGAHNDFYSQSASLRARSERVTASTLASLPFALPPPLGTRLAKTGLGSSAALTVSLIAAFLHILNVPHSRALIHVVAQVAHGRAQGKVGSGFDIASATYGSLLFSRVPAAVLRRVMDAGDTEAPHVWGARLLALAAAEQKNIYTKQDFVPSKSSPVPDETPNDWNFTATPWSLPRGLRLCLADVEGGSATPDMVRRVLAWRDAPVNTTVTGDTIKGSPLEWTALTHTNTRVLEACVKAECAARDIPADYDDALVIASTLPSHLWTAEAVQRQANNNRALSALGELADAFAAWRSALRVLGDVSGVPIEPPAQKIRADVLLQLNGIVAAGVPGAGGEDALFALVVEVPSVISGDGGISSDARAAAEAVWASGDNVIAPLLMREGAARNLPGAGVRLGFSEVGIWGGT
jgi:phosphomevalonate kinase